MALRVPVNRRSMGPGERFAWVGDPLQADCVVSKNVDADSMDSDLRKYVGQE